MEKIIWQTKKVSFKELKFNSKNPRVITDDSAKELKRSLMKFQLVEIPVINADGGLIAGHQRVLALLDAEPEYEGDVRYPDRQLEEDELDDNTLNQYKNKYGKKILTFDKKISDTDRCYNQGYKAVVFARNEVYKIAEKLGYEYFIVLDDDYTYITNRFYFENNKIENTKNGYLNLDILFSSLHKFYVNANLDVLSISQTGDLIGYNFKYMLAGLSRKSMNLFFLSTSRKVTFKGLTNEDTTMYVIEGMRGKKIFSITNIVLSQEITQQNQGGLTDIYKEQGTYVKTFYTIMNAPSCVRIKKLGENHFRYHHLIIWNKCLPKIINKKTPQIKV